MSLRARSRVQPVKPLIEWVWQVIGLLGVLAGLVIFIGLIVPFYQESILRVRESALRNDLYAIRQTIGEYRRDHGRAPKALEDLTADGYLRTIPVDPMTGSNQTWQRIQEEGNIAANRGTIDVQSGSDKVSLDGTKYSDW